MTKRLSRRGPAHAFIPAIWFAILIPGLSSAPTAAAEQEMIPKFTELVRPPSGTEQYLYVAGNFALEDNAPRREPDGRFVVKIVSYAPSTFLVDGFAYSQVLPTESEIGDLVVDCYQRTVEMREMVSLTDTGFTNGARRTGGTNATQANSVGASLVRYMCETEFRISVKAKHTRVSREQALTEILRYVTDRGRD